MIRNYGMPVVSVRISEKVKRILDEAGVDISREVRRFLEDLAWRVEAGRRLERFLDETRDIPPAEKGFSIESVREDREGH